MNADTEQQPDMRSQPPPESLVNWSRSLTPDDALQIMVGLRCLVNAVADKLRANYAQEGEPR